MTETNQSDNASSGAQRTLQNPAQNGLLWHIWLRLHDRRGHESVAAGDQRQSGHNYEHGDVSQSDTVCYRGRHS